MLGNDIRIGQLFRSRFAHRSCQLAVLLLIGKQKQTVGSFIQIDKRHIANRVSACHCNRRACDNDQRSEAKSKLIAGHRELEKISGEDLLNDPTLLFHTREPLVETLEGIGQPFVVDPHLMENGSV